MSKPELLHLAYVDSKNRVRWSVQSPSPLADWARPATSEIGAEVTRSVIKQARETHSTFFSPPYEDESRPSSDNGSPFTDLVAPVFSDDRYVGAVLARVSLPELLRLTVKPELGQRYRIALRDDDGTILAASTSGEVPAEEPRYAVRAPLLSDGIMVQASPFRQRSPVLGNALSWLVVGLTLIVMATLVALARRDVKQAQVERVLRTETAFRRSMEDSLATGMGVIDRTGVLRHVNQAFVQMTGWSAEELIGKSPPFPYWPHDRRAEYQSKLAIVLGRQGAGQRIRAESPASRRHAVRRTPVLLGVVDRRRRTTRVDVRDGGHHGTESHQRTTGRSARAVHHSARVPRRRRVGSRGQSGDELLFANRSYHDLYGSTPAGHRRLRASLSQNAVAGEAFDAEVSRWFDVRTRNVRWVDGRDVRLQIATDITERKATENMVRQQQEKVELTSRLMTMGEMASSLAHELNQPLTAITNYSLGAVTRMKDGGMSNDELLPALEKTAGQAQRAGNIIRRIREFVKRSEPRRRPTEVARIVEDAIGFADIEAAKKGITIHTDVQAGLPPLDVDPILIEQLLLNLLKNAVDAMDQAALRRIDLVVRRQDDMAEFSVIDRGSGVSELQRANLFQPFFSTKSEGMGMGLNICRSIVEFHHGRLNVERNPEGGAIFTFTLPLGIE